MKRIISYFSSSALLSVVLSNSLWAAPLVSGVSGTVSNAQSITITGTFLGSKSSPSPLIFDDFEANAIGANPSGWVKKSGNAVVTGARVRSGQRALVSINPGKGTSNQLIRDLGANSITNFIYVSADMYIEKNDTNSEYQWKVWRWSGYPNVYYANNYPDLKTDNSGFALNAFWSSASSYYSVPNMLGWFNSGNFVYTKSGAAQKNYGSTRNMYGDQNTWFRLEQFITLSSSPDTADGRIDSYTNGTLTNSWKGIVTQAAGDVKYRYFMLTNALESTKDSAGLATTSANMKFYIDNIYIDNSFARIEIGDSPTLAACTKREMQIPTQWADESVTFNVNAGSFNDGDTVYVYVFDNSGIANENGYPIKLGASYKQLKVQNLRAVEAHP